MRTNTSPLLPEFDFRSFMRSLVKQDLTEANLKAATVVNYEGSRSVRQRGGYLSRRVLLRAVKYYFSTDEYPPGVALLKNEIGATITFENFNWVIKRYTEEP